MSNILEKRVHQFLDSIVTKHLTKNLIADTRKQLNISPEEWGIMQEYYPIFDSYIRQLEKAPRGIKIMNFNTYFFVTYSIWGLDDE